jgi:quercetin dioxygenase-like cupin family protein
VDRGTSRRSSHHRGDVLHAEVWADPGSDVPIHYHPSQEERWEVLAGNVRFLLDGERIEAGPGTMVVAPAGVKHAFLNTGQSEAHLRVRVEPALRLQGFLEDAAALARAGAYTRRGIPRRPGAVPQLAALMSRYADVTVMAFPPRIVQRLLIQPMARLSRGEEVTRA